MSLENAFETGRLLKPLTDIADGVGTPRGDVYSAFKLLPGLRGFWPMSAMSAGGRPQDFGGQALDLSYNGGAKYGLTSEGGPYAILDGSGDYFKTGDTSALDISGTESFVETSMQGMTLGGWFWHGSLTGYQGYITKWGDPGQKSYAVYKNSVQVLRFLVTQNGTDTAQLSSSTTPVIGQWYFMVGRFLPAVTIDLFVNGVKDSSANALTSLYNSSRDLRIGNQHGSSSWYLNGRASLCFLCATALPDSVIDNLFQISRGLFGV